MGPQVVLQVVCYLCLYSGQGHRPLLPPPTAKEALTVHILAVILASGVLLGSANVCSLPPYTDDEVVLMHLHACGGCTAVHCSCQHRRTAELHLCGSVGQGVELAAEILRIEHKVKADDFRIAATALGISQTVLRGACATMQGCCRVL